MRSLHGSRIPSLLFILLSESQKLFVAFQLLHLATWCVAPSPFFQEFYDELMSRIASVIDPTRIDIVISLHAEMDHSGCLPQVMKAVNPKHTYASPVGVSLVSR